MNWLFKAKLSLHISKLWHLVWHLPGSSCLSTIKIQIQNSKYKKNLKTRRHDTNFYVIHGLTFCTDIIISKVHFSVCLEITKAPLFRTCLRIYKFISFLLHQSNPVTILWAGSGTLWTWTAFKLFSIPGTLSVCHNKLIQIKNSTYTRLRSNLLIPFDNLPLDCVSQW